MAQLKGSMSHVLTPWNDLWPSYNSNCIQSENVLEENISAEHMNNSSCLQRYKSGSWDLLRRSSVLSVYTLQGLFVFHPLESYHAKDYQSENYEEKAHQML